MLLGQQPLGSHPSAAFARARAHARAHTHAPVLTPVPALAYRTDYVSCDVHVNGLGRAAVGRVVAWLHPLPNGVRRNTVCRAADRPQDPGHHGPKLRDLVRAHRQPGARARHAKVWIEGRGGTGGGREAGRQEGGRGERGAGGKGSVGRAGEHVTRKPALVCRRRSSFQPAFLFFLAVGAAGSAVAFVRHRAWQPERGGVSVAWSCWEPSCAPAATATVDRGWKGGRAACVSDGAVRARLSSAGAGWEGVWSVTCPTGLHVSCSLRSWRPAEGPQGPMQGVLASGRCL